MGQPALAVTDRDTVAGAVKFALACQHHGVSPILGVDLALESLPLAHPAPPASVRTPVRGGAFIDQRQPRVGFLVRGAHGWAQVCHLTTAAHRHRDHPLLCRDDIAHILSANPSVVVLLGPDSSVGRAVLQRRPEQARHEIAWWRSIVGAQSLRIEVVSHLANEHDPRGAPRSTALAARMLELAVEQRITPVLTNAVRHCRPEQGRVVDVLDATRRLVALDERHLDRPNANGYLAATEHMVQIAHHIAGRASVGSTSAVAERLLAVTRELADSCVVNPRTDLGVGVPHPPQSSTAHPDRELYQRCRSGVVRYGSQSASAARRSQVEQRLDDELAVIAHLGFAPYFLAVADIVEQVRDMGIRVAARGSGAGSVVNFLLGISGVDPLEHGLLFERFLSPLRVQLPDIDIDVESARRLEIYERIFEMYGEQRAACVAMTDTYRARHAIRDAGAALGLDSTEIDEIARAFPRVRARDVRIALASVPELRDGRVGRSSHRLGLLLDLVEGLDGLPRHPAMHPCGIVLSDASLLARTPVVSTPAGFSMTQFDKDDVEHLGLLKLDVLGVRMQSAMAYAVTEIARVEGVLVDLDDSAQVPLNDPQTFELVRSTRTIGCFQIESPGQRELIGKFAPESFDDLIIDISLFRPGPVSSDMITPFLRARHGWAPPQRLHPDLWPFLERTEGVVVFHEQVLQIVSTMSGASLARADEVRRALGDRAQHEVLRQWFYPAALDRGYALEVIERVWEVLVAFGSFGFCKAHAAAFALPTFQSAWLKAHHPAAFLAGVLTHDPGMYPKRVILDEARQLGVAILPLDVQRSDAVYRVEVTPTGHGIRLALGDVAGISEAEAEGVVAARPYTDLPDVWRRSGVSQPVLERLVEVGGLDSLYADTGITRRDLLLHLHDLGRGSRGSGRSRGSGGSLSSQSIAARRESAGATQLALLDASSVTTEPTGLPAMAPAEQVRTELEVLGLDASHHVIAFYGDLLRALGATRSRDLLQTRSGSEVVVAGVKVSTMTPPMRSGRRVVFTTLDDATGAVDLAFFDDTDSSVLQRVFNGWLLLATGVLRRSGPRGISLRGTGAWDLAELHALWRHDGLPAVLTHLGWDQ